MSVAKSLGRRLIRSVVKLVTRLGVRVVGGVVITSQRG